VAAVSGNRLGSMIVGAFGQMMRTMAGMPSGSTSSTLSWSWFLATGQGGDRGGLGQGGAPFRLDPGERLHREPGSTYVCDHSTNLR
jgi:hypothetical protein